MSIQTRLNELSAAESARLIAEGSITSEALVSACLERIGAREPVVQAFASLDAEASLRQARACDGRPATGPLHGVPVAVKDVLDTFDLPTQMGSPIYAGHRTFSDAACVSLMRRAGAVILGKTVTAEFAGMAPGATTNPLDPNRTPGGSSSGSAAAVADAMVPLAFGTQTGGSILRPASFCGVIGFKPTYGIVNRAGLKFAAESLDTIGMIGRTVEDVALSMAVLTKGDLFPVAGGRPARIGICRTHLWSKAEAESVTALERAASVLGAQTQVTEIAWPDEFAALSEAREVINDYERARAMSFEWETSASAISPQLSRCIARGWTTPYERYESMLRVAERCRERVAHLFDAADVILSPAVNGEAPLGLTYAGDPSFQGIWTLLHGPAIVIPTHTGPNGMPVGVQVTAPRYADAALLAHADWMLQTMRASQ